MSEEKKQKKVLAYVKDQGMLGKICPQILHDEMIHKHLVKQKSLVVLAEYVLTEEDEGLDLNQLAAKYPLVKKKVA